MNDRSKYMLLREVEFDNRPLWEVIATGNTPDQIYGTYLKVQGTEIEHQNLTNLKIVKSVEFITIEKNV